MKSKVKEVITLEHDNRIMHRQARFYFIIETNVLGLLCIEHIFWGQYQLLCAVFLPVKSKR